MVDPLTKEQAAKQRYGGWAGLPNGRPFDAAHCAYTVQPAASVRFLQCSRKPGHGPDELYCRQHAAKMILR